MSRQFGIYAIGSDLIYIKHLIESVGEPFVVLERIRISLPTFVPDLASSERLQFAIARKDDINEICWSPLGDGRATLDEYRSPVIEIIRPFFNGQKMTRGRFYYRGEYINDDGNGVAKPEAFVIWARGVFRVVKGGLSLNKALPLATYVGPGAQVWLNEHKPNNVEPTGTITAD